MSTEFFNDQWRIPSNENQNKISNYSMNFDGTIGRIDLGTSINLAGKYFTISGWYNIPNITGNISLFSQGSSKNIGIFTQAGILYFYFKTTSWSGIITATTLSTNVWQHIACVYDGSNQIIYINGVAVKTGARTGNVTYDNTPTYLGTLNNTTYPFIGKMDQVSIFDYALSQDQVTQLGAEGYAFNFNGVLQSGDYIDCGIGSRFNLSQITISTWIKKNSSTINYAIAAGIRNNTGPIPYFISLSTAASNQIRFVMAQSDGTNITTFSNAIIQNDIWYHVVGVADGSNVLIYVNGDLQTDQKTYDGTILTPNENFNIGRQAPSGGVYYWDGELSNISVFNTGLQDTDVQTLYNSGKPGNISSLNPIGWWKLDDTATFNSGTSVWSIPDASTNSNTGASFGMDASNLVASNIEGELIANPMIISPKPISYYQLGDQSVDNGANYLVPNNSLSDYVFNFSSDIINISPTIARQQNISYSLWINTTSLITQQYIVGNLQGSANGTGIFINQNELHFQMAKPGSNDSYFNSVVSNISNYVSVNEWFHVAASFDGTDSIIYINGTPRNTWTPGASHFIGGWGNFIIGDGAITSPSYYFGKLSNVAYWDDGLTAPQVATLYNNGAPGNISSLNPAGWWKLNASEIFNNTSTEWSVDNNAYPSVYNSSLDFDGNDYIDLGTPSILGSSSIITLSAWFNPSLVVNNYGPFIGIREAGNTFPYQLGVSNTTKVRFIISESVGTFKFILGNDVLSINNWYHAVAVANGTDLRLYINGVLQNDIKTYSGTLVTPTSNILMGIQSATGTNFTGELSNISMWDTALTASQRTTLYNNGTPASDISSLSPVSWWKLDNTTTGIQDSAGSNNGTNNGTTEYAGFVNALAGESSGMDSSNLVVSDLQQTSGYSPYALDFDGADDFLNSGSASYLNGLSEFSISCWFNLTTAATNKAIVSDWNYNSGVLGHFALETRAASGSNYGLLLFIKDINDGGVNNVATDSILRENTWNNAIFSFNSGTVTCYINGSQVSLTIGGAIPTTLTSQVGSLNIGKFGGVLTRYWNGKLSNIALWNTELTQANATEIYNSGVPSNLNTFSGTKPIIWYQLGSNSSFNTNWTCLNEGSVTGSNAVSAGAMTNDDIVNGVGYSANGLGTSTIDIKGDAPYSTANGLSENMDVLDRVSGTGNVPG